jgi:2-amino-4-hydroxy-6-hydroxymethyldihydropteridine diphosphokinase
VPKTSTLKIVTSPPTSHVTAKPEAPKWVPAVLALGSNLGDRGEHLTRAAAELGQIAGIKVRKFSPIVESFALTQTGIDESKPKYLNSVLLVETNLKPKQLLAACRLIESEHGRVRLEKWGSRTLDVDIITFGSVIKDSKELTLPHPRAYQRGFVLVPWSLADPDAVLLGHGAVAELAAERADEVQVIEQQPLAEPSKQGKAAKKGSKK